jgi:cytoskeletal protein CcmA (bactofilin family)
MARTQTYVESEYDGMATVVGSAIEIRGRIAGQEDLRVHGRVEGAVSLTETLYVEAEGVVQAEVEARDVVVSGILIGDVTASNSVTLNASAKMVGNVSTPRLIIANGAAFRGDVDMGDESSFPTRESRAARAAPARPASTGRARAASRAQPERAERVEREVPRPKPAAAAPPRRAPARSAAAREDDEVTVVVKHAALRKGQAPEEEQTRSTRAVAPKKKAASAKKKGRVRVPSRGKRRVR